MTASYYCNNLVIWYSLKVDCFCQEANVLYSLLKYKVYNYVTWENIVDSLGFLLSEIITIRTTSLKRGIIEVFEGGTKPSKMKSTTTKSSSDWEGARTLNDNLSKIAKKHFCQKYFKICF